MATISENLQTIKNSTDAIKQAIIDKGGDASGDITTWASAISGLSGGGSSEEEYVFTGTISYNMTKVTITGSLNKVPEIVNGSVHRIVALGYYTGGVCTSNAYIKGTGPYTLNIDFEEPLMGTEIPAMCILNIDEGTYTVIPVKFSQQDNGIGGGGYD